MKNELLRLFRKTKRELRYRQLDEVFGEKVEITSPATAAAELKEFLEKKLPWLKGQVQNDLSRQQLMKYGMMDLTIKLTNKPECPPASLVDFRSLGFMEAEQIKVEGGGGLRSFVSPILEEVLEDTTRDIYFVRAYLVGSADYGAIPSRTKIDEMQFRESFPRTLTINDACLTNSDSVWVVKHFWI